MPTHTQVFSGGMKQDVDAHLQQQGTYRYGRNVRTLYNRNRSDTSDGKSLSLANSPGNLLTLTLTQGYHIVGDAEAQRGNVLFLTNNTTSIVGFWDYDSEVNGAVVTGAFRVLYSDDNDPHAKNQPWSKRGSAAPERLGWRTTDTFDIEIAYENESVERVYWTNRRGTKHVLNLRHAPTTTPYPSSWSAHGFRERPDVVFPTIKLLGRGIGKLLSGTYQIAIAYESRDGVRSAFTPVTRRVFVTSEKLDVLGFDRFPSQIPTTGVRLSHHNRVMGASGVVTQESLRWELSRVDVRWERVVVAVLYYETEGLPTSIRTLPPITITPALSGSTAITVEIVDNSGDEITVAELNQRHETVLRVGTLAPENNRLVEGDLLRLPPITMNASAVRFQPFLKRCVLDEVKEPTFRPVANPTSGKPDGNPLTNSSTVTLGSVVRKTFNGLTETYTVTNDYLNDKGQVWEWLHGSYFRGETEEFGVLLFDRLGQPMFVTPLPAFTFPQLYDEGPAGETDHYALTKLSPAGIYELVPMGVLISGLRLPVADLYDSEGKLNVSGFMIVKRQRVPRLLHQGVVFPVCRTDECKLDSGRSEKPFPLPYLNWFSTDFDGQNRHSYPWPTPCTTPNEGDWRETRSQPYYLTYHSPDVLIEGGLKELEEGDVLHHVGIVSRAYSSNVIALDGYSRALPDKTHVTHGYTKSYRTATNLSWLPTLLARGRPRLGSETRLTLAKLHSDGFNTTYKELDKNNLNLKIETQTHPQWSGAGGLYIYGDGLLQRNAVIVKTADWTSIDAGSQENPGTFRIVNYIQRTTQPVDAQSSIEPYYPCGHFQPITESLLGMAKPVETAAGQFFEFNDIEVWGGPAYVTLFDFARIYPFYSDSCRQSDYGIGHVVPVESKYNLALRPGRTLARNAFRPERTTCREEGEQFQNGINPDQPEDWNYNKALTVDTRVNPYAVMPRDFLAVTNDPAGFSWTPPKQPGQFIDAWRSRLPGDAGQANGSLGAIVKLQRGQGRGLLCWQERGVGILPLDPLSYQTTDAGVIETDSGAVFNRMITISTEFGTQHPESVWSSNGQVGAWDARMGALLRYTGGLDSLSASELFSDQLKRLTYELAGAGIDSLRNWQCVAGTNRDNEEILFSFYKPGIPTFTAVYSTAMSSFVEIKDGDYSRFVNRGRLLLASARSQPNTLWAMDRGPFGQYFGTFYPSVVRFIVNPYPNQKKTFDAGQINISADSWRKITRITHWTPDGGPAQVHTLFPANDERFRFFQNALRYAMHEVDWSGTKQRLRDDYMTVEIEIGNDAENKQVVLVAFSTVFR
ncbi:hypothetical protein [Spirosoma sordidisoli]|uniref:Uncharacterized protein n=1 Tax=Spirosoma sordidisoli TaxID=2502893 RepID=A0A4Q2US45_9BACT|nr:hypothetical protein [Spirosoma sordidisoli]RYC70681.1 hypothetical protein EQG79_00585 [Spirosoma sordidisoli]